MRATKICPQCLEAHSADDHFCDIECLDTFAVRAALKDPEVWKASMVTEHGRAFHVNRRMQVGETVEFDGMTWLLTEVGTSGPDDTIGQFIPQNADTVEVFTALARRNLL